MFPLMAGVCECMLALGAAPSSSEQLGLIEALCARPAELSG